MDINDILIFARVAQAGSFSGAARQLQMPVSTVSRRVAQLERQLGIPLLLRTTRSLAVTDVGKAYLQHGQAIASELERAEAFASHLQSVPQGNLRITATSDFGNRFLGGVVHEFLKANPRVKAEVVLTDRVVDLVGEGFDLGIRMGELESSSLVARKIGNLHLQLHASPGYLKARGEPRSCADLEKAECIRFTGEERPDEWRLKGPRGEATARVSGRVSSNDMALIRDFALAGEGIAMIPHFLCADDVRAGRLKVVLKDWVSSPGPVHIVYPSQRFVLPRVRAFVDFLAEKCSEVRWSYRG